MSSLMSANNEAVMFFRDGRVDKEILYPEFESILDGFINFDVYAGREMQAAFVQLNPRLKAVGVVLFQIPFDDKGRVDEAWNIPLQHLADHAEPGPDLGAGPARVACRSMCPVEWYKQQLWDPDLQASPNTFDAIKAALERNRLGLVAEKEEPVAVPVAAPVPAPAPAAVAQPVAVAAAPEGPRFNRKYRQRLKELKAKRDLELRTQSDRLKRHLERIQAKYTEKLNEQDANIEALRQKLLRSRRKELELKELVDGHEQRFQKIQQSYEESLQQGSAEQAAQLSVLREQFEAELQQKLRQQAEDMVERLSMHEVELHYRDEQLANLREEVARLRKENQLALKSDSGQVLQRMSDAGVTFVAYHPGIEHLVLAASEIAEYLRDPIVFVANRCGVSEEHYREWLMHYRLPVCRATKANGEVCGRPVDKVLKPQFFRAGDSDHCELHRKIEDRPAGAPGSVSPESLQQ